MTGRQVRSQSAETGEAALATSADLILLTVEEAAVRLRIGRTSMYRLVATGTVESVTVGRLRRVPVECLAEYVNRLRSIAGSKLPAA
jgi:excisionase family DNA binding protein